MYAYVLEYKEGENACYKMENTFWKWLDHFVKLLSTLHDLSLYNRCHDS